MANQPTARPRVLGAALIGIGLLAVAGCPGDTTSNQCPEVSGCPGVCCSAEALCRRQVCDGAEYTCVDQGGYIWVQGATSCSPEPDAAPAGDQGTAPADGPGPADGPSVDQRPCVCGSADTQPCGPCNMGTRACKADCSGFEDKCTVPSGVCEPSTTRNCGNCNQGSQSCSAACTWGSCTGQPCKPGAKIDCPNGCGQKTCQPSCTWSDCSLSGQLLKPSGDGCYSDSHCPAGSPGGTGRCVDCWFMCTADGSLVKHGWCAACPPCSPINNSCT